ncbi:MAG: hypothetical protein NTX75_03780 [Proteobacteria bacterium]|nr:hypothetical protein [Pseudomonadota bacterium]
MEAVRDIIGDSSKGNVTTDINLMYTDEYNAIVCPVSCIVISRQYSPHSMPLRGTSKFLRNISSLRTLRLEVA